MVLETRRDIWNRHLCALDLYAANRVGSFFIPSASRLALISPELLDASRTILLLRHENCERSRSCWIAHAIDNANLYAEVAYSPPA